MFENLNYVSLVYAGINLFQEISKFYTIQFIIFGSITFIENFLEIFIIRSENHLNNLIDSDSNIFSRFYKFLVKLIQNYFKLSITHKSFIFLKKN